MCLTTDRTGREGGEHEEGQMKAEAEPREFERAS